MISWLVLTVSVNILSKSSDSQNNFKNFHIIYKIYSMKFLKLFCELLDFDCLENELKFS